MAERTAPLVRGRWATKTLDPCSRSKSKKEGRSFPVRATGCFKYPRILFWWKSRSTAPYRSTRQSRNYHQSDSSERVVPPTTLQARHASSGYNAKVLNENAELILYPALRRQSPEKAFGGDRAPPRTAFWQTRPNPALAAVQNN